MKCDSIWDITKLKMEMEKRLHVTTTTTNFFTTKILNTYASEKCDWSVFTWFLTWLFDEILLTPFFFILNSLNFTWISLLGFQSTRSFLFYIPNFFLDCPFGVFSPPGCSFLPESPFRVFNSVSVLFNLEKVFLNYIRVYWMW